MILSILTNGDKGYMLYDAVSKKAVMTGTQKEMEFWKHHFENSAQQKDNREHMNKLRKELELQLITGGHSQEEATQFLKDKMPYLFKK